MKKTLLALLACAPLAAQDQDPQDNQWQQWRVQQRAIFGPDYNPGKGITVFPIDQKVMQTLDKITAFESSKAFDDAARTYQALMDDAGNKVLPVKEDPEFFLGVEAWCEARLLASADLLTAYRRQFDEPVKARIERAVENGDVPALHALARSHPLSTPGRALLIRLGALDYENGDYEESLFCLKRCLTLYPTCAPEVLPMMALDLWRLRSAQGLRDLAESLKKLELESVDVDVAGAKIKLSHLVDSKLRTMPQDWEYSRIPDHFRARSAPALSRYVVKWRHLPNGDADKAPERPQYGFPQSGGDKEPYLLAAANSRRFIVNTNLRIVALDIANGKVVALRQGEQVRADPNTYILRRFGEGDSRPNVSFYGVTEKEGVAYCSLLKTVDEGGRGQRQSVMTVRNLEAYDYSQSKSVFSIKDKTLSMLAPPEPIGDSLYIGVSHREDTTTPPDNFVMRLDRTTGKILWSTFLCMNTGKNVPMFGPFNDAPPIMVTYHAGYLFVASNNGCLGALEAATGQIRWLRSYPQSTTGMMPAPPLIYGDSVIFAGVDLADTNPGFGKIVSYDIESGVLQWQRTFKMGRDNPCTLEGLAEGKILITGPTILCLSAKGGKVLWKQDVMYKIVGKGALSHDTLYVPSSEGVEAYALKDGEHSTVMNWEDPKLDRGALMIVEGGFLSYSDRCVTFYEPPGKTPPKKEKK